MGWCDSPAYFCAASETARDIGEHLSTSQPIGSLAPHPLEHWIMDPTLAHRPDTSSSPSENQITRLLEVYVDDFIHMAQTTDPIVL